MRRNACLAIGVGLLLSVTAASAQPKRIIILRHAEKIDGGDLCATGQLRAEALSKQYLGRSAKDPLFQGGEPAAFYAITGHTRETIEPSANEWNLKVIHPKGHGGEDKDDWENEWTQTAARDALTAPEYDGKIVVMTWEHNHIASDRSDPENTLRHLLKIDEYAAAHPNSIPKNWCGLNYDFFWIVDYADPANPSVPSKVTIVKQTFDDPRIPQNDWLKAELDFGVPGLHADPLLPGRLTSRFGRFAGKTARARKSIARSRPRPASSGLRRRRRNNAERPPSVPTSRSLRPRRPLRCEERARRRPRRTRPAFRSATP